MCVLYECFLVKQCVYMCGEAAEEGKSRGSKKVEESKNGRITKIIIVKKKKKREREREDNLTETSLIRKKV